MPHPESPRTPREIAMLTFLVTVVIVAAATLLVFGSDREVDIPGTIRAETTTSSKLLEVGPLLFVGPVVAGAFGYAAATVRERRRNSVRSDPTPA